MTSLRGGYADCSGEERADVMHLEIADIGASLRQLLLESRDSAKQKLQARPTAGLTVGPTFVRADFGLRLHAAGTGTGTAAKTQSESVAAQYQLQLTHICVRVAQSSVPVKARPDVRLGFELLCESSDDVVSVQKGSIWFWLSVSKTKPELDEEPVRETSRRKNWIRKTLTWQVGSGVLVDFAAHFVSSAMTSWQVGIDVPLNMAAG